MPLSRRTLALPCALLVTLVGASSAQAAITITSPANEGFTNNLRPTVTFTGAAPNGPVTLEVAGSAVVGSTVADSNGDGTVTPTTDIAGPARERFGITLRDPDGVSPNLDTVTVHVDQAPSISGIGDGTTTVPAGVTFNASDAVPLHGVKLYIDGVLDQTPTADGDGWILTDIVPHVTLTPGSHTAWMTSLDDHGVESSPSDTVHFAIAPPAPAFTQVFEGVQLNQALPPVTFHDVNPTATKVSLYELDDDGDEVAVGDTAVVAGGAATIVPTAPLADGRHYLVAKQTVNGVETVDYLGDNGPTTAIVKTSAPVLALSAQNPLVSNTRPSFGVTGALANLVDNDTFVELYIDGQPAGHDGADGGGTTSLRPDGAVGQGAHSAYVITVDDLGHRSAAHSNTVNFTVDTVGPAAPTVTSPANGSTIASSLPVVTATTEPGAIAHVLVDDVGEEVTATADANGTATFTLTQALADGVHTLHVFARDAAGNYGDVTDSTFTVLTAKAPVTPVPPVTPVTPTTPTTPVVNPTDPDGDGIANNWAAPAPGKPKASVSGGKVKLKLAAVPKGAKSVRIYRADGTGGYKLVKTLTPKTKTFTDAKVKPGHSYTYKTVGVNAKGQQGQASATASAKVAKK